MKNTEKSIGNEEDTIFLKKWLTYIFGVSEGKKENETKAKSKEKITKNFSNPSKDINPKIQEAQYTNKEKNKERECHI